MLARLAELDPLLVRTDATFDDLGIGRADSLDDLDLVFHLEDLLDGKLSYAEQERIPSPNFAHGLTVAAFIEAVCFVARDRRAA